MWCNHALSHSAVEDLEETESTVKQLALQAVADDPSVVDEIEERQTIVNMMLEDDKLYQDALRLAAELEGGPDVAVDGG
jgi:MinD-like ATPase involved in chromosome partitioning or flagellar assembly